MNYRRFVALLGAWLRLLVLGEVTLHRPMSGGVERITPHRLIRLADSFSRKSHLSTLAGAPTRLRIGHQTVVCTLRLRADVAGSVNHSPFPWAQSVPKGKAYVN